MPISFPRIKTGQLISGVCTAMTLPSVVFGAFPDVPPDHPNAEAIAYVQSEGIVSGYPDGSYRPDQPINRAEFTKIVIEAIAEDEELQNCDLSTIEYLSDMDVEQWYAPHVCVGRARDIITGHLPSSAPPYFAPAERINLIGAAKIITVGFGIGEPPLDCLADWAKACIEAAQQGNPWYRRHLLALGARNAIPTSIKSFHLDDITRGEMAEMIWRVRANIDDRPSFTFSESEFVAGWHTDFQHGFLIGLPSGWSTFDRDENRISFGQLSNFENHGYDGEWFVSVFDTVEMSVDRFAQNMGSQFSDRKEVQEQVVVNGAVATKVTVTTPSVPSWVYEAILIEHEEKLYAISNGAIRHGLFDEFYNTFRVLPR